MKVEIETTDRDDRALIAALMAYRASPRAPQGTPFEREFRFERRLALECFDKVIQILQRGASPVLDCAVIETVATLEQKAMEQVR